jgi:hypothetical protein
MADAPDTLVAHLDRVRLSVPAGPSFRGALRLLLGGLGSNSGLSYEQVNELQLAVEALIAHREVAGESVLVEADLDAGALVVAVGPFVPGDDPAGRRVLDRLVQRARSSSRHDGEWIELAAGHPAAAREGEPAW